MPELKAVYFAPDGTFFDKREDCERYEKSLEISGYLNDFFGYDSANFEKASYIVQRYNVDQRYDYKPQETTPDE